MFFPLFLVFPNDLSQIFLNFVGSEPLRFYPEFFPLSLLRNKDRDNRNWENRNWEESGIQEQTASPALIPWKQQCLENREKDPGVEFQQLCPHSLGISLPGKAGRDARSSPQACLDVFPLSWQLRPFPGAAPVSGFGFSKDPFIPREPWKQRERGKAREGSSGHGRAAALIPKKPGYPKYSSR